MMTIACNPQGMMHLTLVGLPQVLKAFISPPQWPQRLKHSPLNEGKGINHQSMEDPFHDSACWTCGIVPFDCYWIHQANLGYTHRMLLVKFLSVKISEPMTTNVVTWLWLLIGVMIQKTKIPCQPTKLASLVFIMWLADIQARILLTLSWASLIKQRSLER